MSIYYKIHYCVAVRVPLGNKFVMISFQDQLKVVSKSKRANLVSLSKNIYKGRKIFIEIKRFRINNNFLQYHEVRFFKFTLQGVVNVGVADQVIGLTCRALQVQLNKIKTLDALQFVLLMQTIKKNQISEIFEVRILCFCKEKKFNSLNKHYTPIFF